MQVNVSAPKSAKWENNVRKDNTRKNRVTLTCEKYDDRRNKGYHRWLKSNKKPKRGCYFKKLFIIVIVEKTSKIKNKIYFKKM